MYFGNSRVTIRKSANCDFYGITDKTFVVSFINGYIKDNVFLAYSPSCVGFDGLEALAKLNFECIGNEFCSGGTSAPIDVVNACNQYTSVLDDVGVYVLENTFQLGPTGSGPIGRENSFCTTQIVGGEDCSCPNGYTKASEYYGDTCFHIFPIESIGLTFTDEIDPCRFFFLAKQDDSIFVDIQNTVASIYYKTYDENGLETCNVASFSVSPNPCSDTFINCWPPPGPDLPLIPAPDGNNYTPCEYCELFGEGNGDVCFFEGLAIASNTCVCPYTVNCYSEDYDPASPSSSGNCFFAPGVTTTEPCVNGSWNGQTCTEGYNDVCGSTACINKICKELDWFIQNYAGYRGDPTGFLGYSSRVSDSSAVQGATGTSAEFWVSCGPTGVSAYDDFDVINVTFGEYSSLRQWGRIVGLLNYFSSARTGKTPGEITDSQLIESEYLDFTQIGGTSCGWFYPMNLCCPPVPEGAFDYDCPFCGPSGFTTHSPSDTSCCCAKNMIPIVFGLNNVDGYASADAGLSSIGIQPST
jgi:hypothetical protein